MLGKGMMSSLITDNNRCGTQAGGFLKGGHPKVEDGVVDRNVCFWYNNKCDGGERAGTKVVNCGDYYLYYLPKVPGCYLRYCMEA